MPLLTTARKPFHHWVGHQANTGGGITPGGRVTEDTPHGFAVTAEEEGLGKNEIPMGTPRIGARLTLPGRKYYGDK